MGTWGPGNFDGDTETEHLLALTDQLIGEVSTAMANPKELKPGWYWGDAVPCNIEILNLIARERWSGAKAPGVAVAEQWKRDYLTVWDGAIGNIEPEPNYKIERREVLVQTFDELIRHALRRENDYDEVIARLNNPSDAFERDVLTRALVDKAITLNRDGKHEEAIVVCDDVAARFGSASEAIVLQNAALALSWKAHSLWTLGRIEEAIAIYDAIADRFGAASGPISLKQAANALFTKAYKLKEAGRTDEAADAYRDLIARFGSADDAEAGHLAGRAQELLNALS